MERPKIVCDGMCLSCVFHPKQQQQSGLAPLNVDATNSDGGYFLSDQGLGSVSSGRRTQFLAVPLILVCKQDHSVCVPTRRPGGAVCDAGGARLLRTGAHTPPRARAQCVAVRCLTPKRLGPSDVLHRDGLVGRRKLGTPLLFFL